MLFRHFDNVQSVPPGVYRYQRLQDNRLEPPSRQRESRALAQLCLSQKDILEGRRKIVRIFPAVLFAFVSHASVVMEYPVVDDERLRERSEPSEG